MYYRHNLDYQYPERFDAHMITVKHLRDVTVDEHYPYLQKSFWFKCQRVFYWMILHGVIFWLLRITHGLHIYGKENLKKHKATLKNGAITISNHVFKWDFLCTLKAIRPRLTYFPAWKNNLEGPDGPLIRVSGGIPIPAENIRRDFFSMYINNLFRLKHSLSIRNSPESGIQVYGHVLRR